MGYESVRYRKQLKVGGDRGTAVSIEDGIAQIKEMAGVTADRSYKNGKKRKSVDQPVEIVLHLGIDPRQADQMLRGAISLPKGIGKARRVGRAVSWAGCSAHRGRCPRPRRVR